MLLEFTVENYRSFYRKKTLVLEADKALKECTETNLFDCNKYTLLRSLALYGVPIQVGNPILSVRCTQWRVACCCR